MKKTLISVAGMLLLFSLCFVLPATAFTVYSPNGGENWQAGTTHSIKWYLDEFEAPRLVQINLYEQSCGKLPSGIPICFDIFKKTIAPSVSTATDSTGFGTYSWPIPSDQAPGSSYRIELKVLSTGGYDRSNGVFTISGIRVTSPNGGENWVRGTAHKITWTQAGLTGTNVKVDLLTYSSIITFPPHLPSSSPIVSSVPASQGYYYWTPPIIPPGPPYAIYHPFGVKVTSLSYPTLSDTSDKSFDLTNPSAATITVTSPKAGDVWQPGTTHTVTWTSTGAVGPNVKIELLQANIPVGTANANTPNDGSQDWAISATRASGTNYKIRVTSLTTGISGTSGEFTIGQPGPTPALITVTSPNGGETWKRGTTHPITWKYTGSPGSYVKIELLQGGTAVGTATYSTSIGSAGIGSYPWTISSGRAPGTNYRMRITSVSQPAISDTSNSDFTITA